MIPEEATPNRGRRTRITSRVRNHTTGRISMQSVVISSRFSLSIQTTQQSCRQGEALVDGLNIGNSVRSFSG